MTELGVFAKYWEPGRVKTRLARHIGDPAAREIYRAFLRCIAERFGNVADGRRFVVTPANRRQDIELFLSDNRWQVSTQVDGDLGRRMQAYFEQTLATCGSAVLLGSDSPNLPRDILSDAFDLLKQYQVVAGPAEDGGYYLIGVAGSVPEVFHEIDWSTDRVWEQTRRHLTEANVRFALLPVWYDIDTAVDLGRLVTGLRAQVDDPPLQDLLKTIVTLNVL
jgi:rSAM/selenodomain-associated transferase 1